MKLKSLPLFPFQGWCLLFLLPLLGLGLAGCANPDYSGAMLPNDANGTNIDVPAAVLLVGDSITITFEGPPEPWPQLEKTINEDGTVTLTDIGPVKAAGRTTGQLEVAIHDLYVPKYVLHLNVTVKAGDRVFFVKGAVKGPGRQIYINKITVTQAITSAGDFEEFANHKNVVLIRNGKNYTINCDAILNNGAPDPPVFPGDQIVVYRRHF